MQPSGGRSPRLGLRALLYQDQPALEGSPGTITAAHRAEEKQRQEILLQHPPGSRAVAIEAAAVATLKQFGEHAQHLLVRWRRNLADIIAEGAACAVFNRFAE